MGNKMMDDWKAYLEEQDVAAIYIAALAQEDPDPSSIAAQDGPGPNGGARTLFKIYKLKADKLWEPEALENIKLEVGI